jgi:hypothetical protein
MARVIDHVPGVVHVDVLAHAVADRAHVEGALLEVVDWLQGGGRGGEGDHEGERQGERRKDRGGDRRRDSAGGNNDTCDAMHLGPPLLPPDEAALPMSPPDVGGAAPVP